MISLEDDMNEVDRLKVRLFDLTEKNTELQHTITQLLIALVDIKDAVNEDEPQQIARAKLKEFS